MKSDLVFKNSGISSSTISILQKTILDLINISESDKKIIWNHFELLQFDNLNFPSEEWDRLRRYCVYPEDSLENILSLSLGYIHDIWQDENKFNKIISNVLKFISDIIGHDIAIQIENICDDKKIFGDIEIKLLDDLITSPSFVPQELVLKLHNHGIFKWKEISEISEFYVINKLGFISNSIDLLNCLWSLYPYARKLIEKMTPLIDQKENWSSFESIIIKWLFKKAKNIRDTELVMQRMGWGCDEPKTLEEVAQMYGLSRERVRQIEGRLLPKIKKIKSSIELYPLWIVVDSFLQESSGIISKNELAKKLRMHFKWENEPSSSGLENVKAFAPEQLFRRDIDDGNLGILFSNNFYCEDCKKISDYLIDLVSKHEEISFDYATNELNKFCKTNCSKGEKHFFNFHEIILDFLMFSNESVKENIRKKERMLYSLNRWNIRYGSLVSAAETILKQSRQAMHFTEIYDEIKKFRPDNLSLIDRNVHAALDRSENVILWDRGTFIHIENAVFPYGLIRKIEKWIEESLKQGIPFVSAFGAFKAFKNKCLDAGIPSEVALYSCLRLSGDHLFAFPKIPYIYLNTGNVQRIPLPLVIEEFIREAEGTVSMKELQKFTLEDLHFKDFMLTQLMARVPNVLRTKDGYLHTDYIKIEEKKLSEIVSYTKNIIDKEKHVSISKIFNAKKITCILMGINNPMLLYSVLQQYSSDEIQATRYPQISSIDIKSMNRKGIINEVVEYIKNKKTLCAYQELEDHFVNSLGYAENIVYLVALRDGIYRYLQGALIHEDTIGWKEEKQKQLEDVAIHVYADGVKAGRCYGLIDEIIETYTLPDLDSGLYWTEILVADILDNCDNFKVLGSRKNAFVLFPNEFNIECFEDLIYEILKCNYKGAENLEVFTGELMDLAIITKSITKSMLGNSEKVSIIGKEIMLTELMHNA